MSEFLEAISEYGLSDTIYTLIKLGTLCTLDRTPGKCNAHYAPPTREIQEPWAILSETIAELI